MVFRVSTAKIVSRPIEPVEEVLPEITFIAIDTYIETSRKDEFIIGNLFDYNGNKINYVWDSKKNQIASLKGTNLNTEVIVLASEFLKSLYKRSDQNSANLIDTKALSTNIVDLLKELTPINRTFTEPVKEINSPKNKEKNSSKNLIDEDTIEDQDFIYDYENDDTEPVFTGEFLEDDQEVDDFDEQLAIKSQEFLKEHPELKSEMEIVRLLEGNS
jgi:hypothetical protein